MCNFVYHFFTIFLIMKNKTLQLLIFSLLFCLPYILISQDIDKYSYEKRVLLQRSYIAHNGAISTISVDYNKDADREIEIKAAKNISKIFTDEIIVLTFGYRSTDTICWAVSIDRNDYDQKYLDYINRLSPGNLVNDIPWDDDPNIGGNQNNFGGPTYTAAAFNHGRRVEEDSLNLTLNILGDLAPPYGLSGDNEMIYELNSERSCRANIDYGNGNVLGLPYQDGEYNIDTLAQSHANYLVATNTFSHTGYGGSSPFDRINNNTKIGDAAHCGITGGCHQFINRAENIAAFFSSTSSNKSIISRSVYSWIYADQPSAWGHREACLLQNVPLSGCCGFTNDFGSSSSEGFMGMGTAGSATYNPFGFPGINRGDVVVLNFFDPLPSATSNYTPLIWNQLPMVVAMKYFDGRLDNNQTMLRWETLSEVNNKMFVIERSIDGDNFEPIGSVNGIGNSVINHVYDFVDQNPIDGVNYYRLKQVDFDERYEYSDIIQVRKSPNNLVSISSLLYNNQLNIISNLENYSIDIYSVSGTAIYHAEELSYDQKLDVNLSKGMYFAHIQSNNDTYTFKFVKE